MIEVAQSFSTETIGSEPVHELLQSSYLLLGLADMLPDLL